MFGLRLGFDHPGYLWLLIALPLLWWIGYRSLASLGTVRQLAALSLRSLIWTVIVLAISGVQWVWTHDRLTVMYLLDQSESIPVLKRQAMLTYVIQSVREHRDQTREDRAGIIVFGREAAIEIPPFDDDIPELRQLESLQDGNDATNLESALNLAQASMPEDTARRVVIVTDGNENLGRASKLASQLGNAGIGIDVVPVLLNATSEVLVEKIDLPDNIRKGQPFEARVVISNYSDADSSDAVTGKLRVKQKVSGEETLLLEEAITLSPGKNIFPLRYQIEQPAAYIYDAEFIPDSQNDDAIRQNNSATAYTYVSGKGRVLLIEEKSKLGDFDLLTESLRNANIEVVKQASDQLYGTLAELQAYDAVILAGVPRVSGEQTGQITSFSDAQIDILVANTQQLGAGLLMIGGPEAFGAGGWTGTQLEKAMPVDFKVKNSKVRATGALALIMHASEMPEGNYWQKVIAKAAVEQLGPSDYGGVLHWAMGGDAWLWGGSDLHKGMLEVGPNRKSMLARINRMTPGDMPQFDPAMRMAVAGLARTPAAVKHCIIISDGDPSPPAPSTIQSFINNNITISTVAVESHGLTDSQRLRDIAQATGGKYYSVSSGRALPKIYQREARRVSRPLVYEPQGGTVPQIIFPHASMEGIPRDLPPISGFVLTQTKENPLSQVIVQSPKPDSPENATIAAAWTYGLGRTAVVTTDAGARWASNWTEWEGYEKFYSQLVRWLMRPTGDNRQFSIASQVRDDEVKIVVNALSDDDTFLNFLDMQASAIAPDLEPLPLRMRQAAPGRYVGSFKVEKTGSYFVNVLPGAGASPVSTGVTVPYSDEYRVRQSNLSLIDSLASQIPLGGQTGQVFPKLDMAPSDELLSANAFRSGLAPARSIRDAWPWFVLFASSVFLLDVFVRRVAIRSQWLSNLLFRNKLGDEQNSVSTRLDALRKNKENIERARDRLRTEVRFDTDQSETADNFSTTTDTSPPQTTSNERSIDSKTTSQDKTNYTERLLEAKRRARKK